MKVIVDGEKIDVKRIVFPDRSKVSELEGTFLKRFIGFGIPAPGGNQPYFNTFIWNRKMYIIIAGVSAGEVVINSETLEITASHKFEDWHRVSRFYKKIHWVIKYNYA